MPLNDEEFSSLDFFLKVISTDEIQLCDLFDRLAPGSPINFKSAMESLLHSIADPVQRPHAPLPPLLLLVPGDFPAS